MQMPGYPIVLGNLSAEQCRTFAEAMNGDDFPGVVGPGESALRFAETAEQLGASFAEKKYQLILLLTERLRSPAFRGLRGGCLPRILPFSAPGSPPSSRKHSLGPNPGRREALRASIASRRHWFWTYEGSRWQWPPSRAELATPRLSIQFSRHTHTEIKASALQLRLLSRARSFKRRAAASLYVDADNRASMRCYAKLGFKPLCDSWLIVRRKGRASLMPSLKDRPRQARQSSIPWSPSR